MQLADCSRIHSSWLVAGNAIRQRREVGQTVPESSLTRFTFISILYIHICTMDSVCKVESYDACVRKGDTRGVSGDFTRLFRTPPT